MRRARTGHVARAHLAIAARAVQRCRRVPCARPCRNGPEARVKKATGAVLGEFESKRLPSPFSPVLSQHRAADFLSLTKPRLNFLVVITAAVGYYLGAASAGSIDVLKWAEAIIGT